MADDQIVLTGVKPTGSPHIGNLFRHRARHRRPQTRPEPHCSSLRTTTRSHVRDPEILKHQTYAVAATWLAFGLDVERTMFYRQSDIPEVFELAWILSCYSPKGYMVIHAYKARVQDNASRAPTKTPGSTSGCSASPILMAADILLFDAHSVPVGKDQVQHVEIARDIAQRLNHACGAEVLRLPKAEVSANTATVPGLDGRNDKSYGNVVPLFETSKRLRKTILRSRPTPRPLKRPKIRTAPSSTNPRRCCPRTSSSPSATERYNWGEAKTALRRDRGTRGRTS